MKKKIAIIGAGNFGTSLAHLFAKKGHQVSLWARQQEIVDSINEKSKNPIYLPDLQLASMSASQNLLATVQGQDCLVFAIPTQYLAEVLAQLPWDKIKGSSLVNTSKGIEKGSLHLPSQIFVEHYGEQVLDVFAVLSGPTFAIELAEGEPTGAVIASKNNDLSTELQTALSYQWFRLYTSQDVLGVELGGALKNVMAIGAGMSEGLGFGLNSQAGFITRCLAEMTRLGIKMGADPLTFSGLSGLGDLVLTCTGSLSRNRKVGLRLGQGESLDEIQKSMKSVAEGVSSALSIQDLSKKYEVEMPNATFVYRILYEGLSPEEVLLEMKARALKSELN